VSVRVLAQPGATCSLAATDSSGQAVTTGTQAAKANASGDASWVWHLPSGMTPGNYRLLVSCHPGTSSTSTLTVTH